MYWSATTTLPYRISDVLVCGLALALMVGCHPGSGSTARPPAPDDVQIGYGEQSKEQLGGAVQSATDEELSDVKAVQVEQLLENRFPGVYVVRTPSGGFSVRIRGAGTVSGSAEPLYVVDGIPVEATPGRGLDWLNPADIERIDVLKNPAETSMYGLRGANGVVVITTKR